MTPSQLARAALRAAQRACDKLGDLLQPLQHGFQPFRFPRAPDMLRRQRGAKVVARTRSRASEIGSKGIDLRPYPTIPDFARVRACQESQGRRSCPIVTPSSRCASGSASWRPSAFWQRSRSCRRFRRSSRTRGRGVETVPEGVLAVQSARGVYGADPVKKWLSMMPRAARRGGIDTI